MVTHSVRSHRSGILGSGILGSSIVALAAVAMLGATGSLVAYQASVSRTDKFQELADNAAIAGVNALVRTEGLPDAVRMEAARIAATNVVAAKDPAATVLAPSTNGPTMSVTLTRNATGKGSAVTAKARYVEPGEAVSDTRRGDLRQSRPAPEQG